MTRSPEGRSPATLILILLALAAASALAACAGTGTLASNSPSATTTPPSPSTSPTTVSAAEPVSQWDGPGSASLCADAGGRATLDRGPARREDPGGWVLHRHGHVGPPRWRDASQGRRRDREDLCGTTLPRPTGPGATSWPPPEWPSGKACSRASSSPAHHRRRPSTCSPWTAPRSRMRRSSRTRGRAGP